MKILLVQIVHTMATKNQKRKKKRQRLLDTLRPFLNVPITENGHVWLYVGRPDAVAGGVTLADGTVAESHLHTNDFLALREALGE